MNPFWVSWWFVHLGLCTDVIIRILGDMNQHMSLTFGFGLQCSLSPLPTSFHFRIMTISPILYFFILRLDLPVSRYHTFLVGRRISSGVTWNVGHKVFIIGLWGTTTYDSGFIIFIICVIIIGRWGRIILDVVYFRPRWTSHNRHSLQRSSIMVGFGNCWHIHFVRFGTQVWDIVSDFKFNDLSIRWN